MATHCFAGMYLVNDDESPVLRVFNSSPDQDCVIVVGATFNTNETITVTFGSDTANTLSNGMGTNDSVSLLATSLATTTNDDGKAFLIVDAYSSVGTDITTNRFLTDTTNTIASNSWGTVAYWDTSVIKHTDLYVPSHDRGGVAVATKVKDLWCSTTGTGSLTLDVYVNGTQWYHRLVSTNSFNLDALNVGNYDITKPFDLGNSKSLLFRASRETTLTDAYIGGITE